MLIPEILQVLLNSGFECESQKAIQISIQVTNNSFAALRDILHTNYYKFAEKSNLNYWSVKKLIELIFLNKNSLLKVQ